MALFDRFEVIDVDTHITEPPDTWTSRVSRRWGDDIPHVERVEGTDTWMVNGKRWSTPGNTAMAGFDGTLPDGPATYEDMHPGAWDPAARVAFMDQQRIRAQVLYPNLGGFGAGAWLDQGDPAFALECVQAYNNFQTDFASVAPDRLLPIVSLPFWDVDASVAEIERCVDRGHRGINFCNQPDAFGEPHLWAGHWDPIWAAARGHRRSRQLPYRRRPHRRTTGRGCRPGVPGQLLAGVLPFVCRQPPLHRRPHPRRGVPPLP